MHGERLKEARERAGYTQEELAHFIGKTAKDVWGWEKDKFAPRSETLPALASALNVTIDYLLGVSDSPTPEPRARDLSEEERAVILALRRGDRMGAIRTIAAAEAERERP